MVEIRNDFCFFFFIIVKEHHAIAKHDDHGRILLPQRLMCVMNQMIVTVMECLVEFLDLTLVRIVGVDGLKFLFRVRIEIFMDVSLSHFSPLTCVISPLLGSTILASDLPHARFLH